MSEGFDTRLRAVEEQALTAALRIEGHEKVCAERYAAIAANMAAQSSNSARTNGLLLKLGVMLVGGMAAILAKLVFFP